MNTATTTMDVSCITSSTRKNKRNRVGDDPETKYVKKKSKNVKNNENDIDKVYNTHTVDFTKDLRFLKAQIRETDQNESKR
jgi:hypothetical protein